MVPKLFWGRQFFGNLYSRSQSRFEFLILIILIIIFLYHSSKKYWWSKYKKGRAQIENFVKRDEIEGTFSWFFSTLKNFFKFFYMRKSAHFTIKRIVFTGSTKNMDKKFYIGPKFSICARPNKIRGLYKKKQNKRLALLMPQK